MKKELAPAQVAGQELITILQNSQYPGAASESVALVVSYCEANNLDPFQKPVHIVPMWSKDKGRMIDVIMPGIGLYRIQAARTGQYAGISEPTYGPRISLELGGVTVTVPEWCQVTVKRQLENGQIAEFIAREYWVENYATKGKDSIAPNAMWQRRGYGQLGKCTEAQALRKAFPEVGGAPTAEEMEGKHTERDITASVTREPSPAPAASDLPQLMPAKFAKLLPTYKAGIEEGKSSPADVIAFLETKYSVSEEQREAIRALDVIQGN